MNAADDAADRAATGDGPPRTRAVVAAELADVERYLAEIPPHAGGGRDAMERRRAALQRELAALRPRTDGHR